MRQNKTYRQTPIPHRSQLGEPMKYYILSEDDVHIKVTRAECLARAEESNNPYPQRWFVDEESGLVIRLPRTAKGEELARDNMQFVWREAKRKERWAERTVAPTIDDDGMEIPFESVDESKYADVIGLLEDKALFDTL